MKWKKIFALAMALALFFSCRGENLPSQEGLDAACALAAMRDAVARDVFGEDFSISTLKGASEIYVLFSDEEGRVYLMVSLEPEQRKRAEAAILQSTRLTDFWDLVLPSLDALVRPFSTDGDWATYESWREACRAEIGERLRRNEDFEMNWWEGQYLSCTLSVWHDGAETLFTAAAEWKYPLSAEDITRLMEP